jgi:hypothetical protein
MGTRHGRYCLTSAVRPISTPGHKNAVATTNRAESTASLSSRVAPARATPEGPNPSRHRPASSPPLLSASVRGRGRAKLASLTMEAEPLSSAAPHREGQFPRRRWWSLAVRRRAAAKGGRVAAVRRARGRQLRVVSVLLLMVAHDG